MASASAVQPKVDENPIFTDAAYKPLLNNWYTSKPYGFRFTPKGGQQTTAKVMYLPINPSNLTINTHFATNLIPTIYGTVEEHSPVRYYDIVIEGTTGISPKYTDPISYGETMQAKPGRSSFTIQSSLGTGLLSKTVNTLQTIFNDATNIINGGKPSTPVTGLQLDQTGYSAFHNLYRFLLAHKKDVTESTSTTASTFPPLVFFNFKDGNEYNVVIKTFTLKRDKENPMLYYYNIVMRGYNLAKVDSGQAKDEVGDVMKNLGLNGIKGSSILGEIKNAAAGAKDIFASVANGVNQLGR